MKPKQWLLGVLVALLPAAAAAQQGSWPTSPIRVIVPYPPGSSGDIIVRRVAPLIAQKLGGTVYVDNRAGANGHLAVEAVKNAAPDGYTLLLGSNSTHILVPLIAKQPGFDPIKDFELATVFSITSTAIAVHPGSPYRTLKDLIDAAKANPGKLSFAHAGVGSISHVAGEMFKQLAGGLDVLPVPYKGMGPAQMDVVNGTVSMFVPNITGAVIGLHTGGKIRIIAVNAPTRHHGMPDVPTAIEAGLPGMITQNFFGIYAPAGTPKPVLDRVNEATQQALADKDFQLRLSNAAFDPVSGLGPDKSKAYVADEFARWRKVVEAAKLRE
jgi:tripartite-type tricarboxylate transporter receptor subunit TctC